MEQSLSLDFVINTWELMDYLDDDSDDNSKPRSLAFHHGVSNKPSSCRSTNFDGFAKNLFNSFESSLKSSSEVVVKENQSPSDYSKSWQGLQRRPLLKVGIG